MIVTDIIAKDFLSFGSVYLELPKTGLILVTGWDEDLERANGAGKSSLFQALSWCLYGELPRDVKVDELIRRGQASCSVTVKFEIDVNKYTITRKRPSGLEFFINGEKQKGNPKFVQALIEQTIGLSYSQFLITSFFPQRGDGSRFIKQNDSAAKDFLGTILNFNKTDHAYKKLHVELKELELLASGKQAELKTVEQSIERFKEIVDMPIPAMPDKDEIIKTKSEYTVVDLATKTKPDTSAVDAEIEKVSSAVEKVRSAKYTVSTSLRAIEDKKRRAEHVLASDSHYLTCPSCAAELLESSGRLVEFDEEAAEAVKKQKVDQIQSEIEELQQQLEKLSPMVEKESAFQLKLDNLKQKRLQARHDYDMAVQTKTHIQSKMASFKQAILAHQQAREQKDKIAHQLAAMEASLVVKTAELKTLESELMLLAAAKGVMSPTGAIAYSLDAVMGDLNDEVGQYLDIFSHNTMTYRLSSGDDKAKVTHSITKGGVDCSVGSLSGGEERGLIISVDLGLGKVISARSGVNLPSVLMLDECFEGLDTIGKEKVLDALREISRERCIVVIDHNTEFNALFDQSIKVLKKSDVSRLEST